MNKERLNSLLKVIGQPVVPMSESERLLLIKRSKAMELSIRHHANPEHRYTTEIPNTDEIGKNTKGVVYLIKAGEYYKIGKTIDITSRLARLQIQLPHKPELVHSIETDDIHWLEKHWHKYFAQKRMNGEWFGLTEDDVQEFKAVRQVIKSF